MEKKEQHFFHSRKLIENLSIQKTNFQLEYKGTIDKRLFFYAKINKKCRIKFFKQILVFKKMDQISCFQKNCIFNKFDFFYLYGMS